MRDPGDKPADRAAGGFLSRWSRRKAESRQTASPEPEAPGPEAPQPSQAEAFDPASLPPVESLTAESDFSVFLKAGVPPSLRAAALRKLWLTDPTVLQPERLVEYGWDFNAPDYGGLVAQERIAKLTRHVFEGSPRSEPADMPEQASSDRTAIAETDTEPVQIAASQAEAPPLQVEDADLQEAEAAEPKPVPRRRHGGALPR